MKKVQVERTGYREVWTYDAQDPGRAARGTERLATRRVEVPLRELAAYIVADLSALAPPMESPTADRPIEYTVRVHPRYHIPYEVLEVLPHLGGIVAAAADALGGQLERLEVAQEPGEDVPTVVVVEACVRGRRYL